jgi:5-dehydro-2-deoxygluconokinase
VAKCLIWYHPDDEAALRAAQAAKLRSLARACAATARDLLVEVLAPREAHIDAETTARSLEQLYDAGVRPDWWKLPPLTGEEAWSRVSAVIGRNDPHCRGVLLLGLEAEESVLEASFAVAARFPVCKGFAVGRSIFGAAAREWFAGRSTDDDVVTDVATRYARLIGLWERARSSARVAAA